MQFSTPAAPLNNPPAAAAANLQNLPSHPAPSAGFNLGRTGWRGPALCWPCPAVKECALFLLAFHNPRPVLASVPASGAYVSCDYFFSPGRNRLLPNTGALFSESISIQAEAWDKHSDPAWPCLGAWVRDLQKRAGSYAVGSACGSGQWRVDPPKDDPPENQALCVISLSVSWALTLADINSSCYYDTFEGAAGRQRSKNLGIEAAPCVLVK